MGILFPKLKFNNDSNYNPKNLAVEGFQRKLFHVAFM